MLSSASSGASRYDPAAIGYSKALAREVIAEIRTDLDYFSDAEAAVLQNHGYFLADAAMKKHGAALLPQGIQPLVAPFPDWFAPKKTEAEIREALKDSPIRKKRGRWKPK